MSVINKMLQDLEQRNEAREIKQAATPVYEDLRPVTRPRTTPALRLGMLLLLGTGVVGTGFYLWVNWDGRSSPDRPIKTTALSPAAVSESMPAKPTAGTPAHAVASSQVATPPSETPLPVSAAAPEPVQPKTAKLGTPASAELAQAPPPKTHQAPQASSSSGKPMTATPAPTPVRKKIAASKAPQARTEAGSPDSAVIEKRAKPLTTRERADEEYRKAAVMLQQGRENDVMQHLRTALAIHPAHAKARELLVGLTLRDGHWRQAQELLEQGMVQAPQHYPFIQLLARIHVERGNEGQAITLLEGAQQQAGADPDYMALLATLYQRTGRHQDAIKAYTHALGLRPEDGRWWLGMAISLEAERNWQNAAEAYQRATATGSLDNNLLQYAQQRLAVVRRK